MNIEKKESVAYSNIIQNNKLDSINLSRNDSKLELNKFKKNKNSKKIFRTIKTF